MPNRSSIQIILPFAIKTPLATILTLFSAAKSHGNTLPWKILSNSDKGIFFL